MSVTNDTSTQLARVALVTGGLSGIGRSIVQRLIRDGFEVITTYRGNYEAATQTAIQIGMEAGVDRTPRLMEADVSSASSVTSLFEQIRSFLGKTARLEVLVNNAGITRDGPTASMSEEDWDAVLGTNLKGVFLCCQQALPIMSRQRSGSIINMSSVVGRTGSKFQANYAASKAGVIGLTYSLAREYGPKRGIRINAVAPGYVDTRMTNILPQELKDAIIGQTVLGRMGEVGDVAGVVSFLASPDAAFITGTVIDVNGGLWMG